MDIGAPIIIEAAELGQLQRRARRLGWTGFGAGFLWGALLVACLQPLLEHCR